LAPHVHTAPRESAQHEWRLAAASATTRQPRRACRRRGEGTESGPQEEEEEEDEDEYEEPKPEAAEEEEEASAGAPRPSLPSLFEPHAHTAPSAVAASEWCFPKATTTTRSELPSPPLLVSRFPPAPPPPGKSTRLGSTTAPKEGAT
jgi:hypothetical protein